MQLKDLAYFLFHAHHDLVVQRVDNSMDWLSLCPVDKYLPKLFSSFPLLQKKKMIRECLIEGYY